MCADDRELVYGLAGIVDELRRDLRHEEQRYKDLEADRRNLRDALEDTRRDSEILAAIRDHFKKAPSGTTLGTGPQEIWARRLEQILEGKTDDQD